MELSHIGQGAVRLGEPLGGFGQHEAGDGRQVQGPGLVHGDPGHLIQLLGRAGGGHVGCGPAG